MIGLRVRTPGRPVCFIALKWSRYDVYVDASCTQRRPRDRQRITFSVFGIDDRHDLVAWFRCAARRVGSWVEIEVVDEPEPTPPRRGPKRKQVDWDKHFARMRARDVRKAARLEARLLRLRAGSKYRAPLWTMAEPTRAFRILRNGRKVDEVSVDRPGSLSVTVGARRRRGRQTAFLHIHGGDRVGPHTHRSYAWTTEQTSLEIGDRVRILVVPSRPGVVRRVCSVDCLEPSSIDEITRELKRLHANLESDHYRKEALLMRNWKRPPAREYGVAPRAQPTRGKPRRS